MGKQGGGGIPIVSGKALRKALEDSTTTYIDIAIGDLFVKPKLPKSGEVKHYRLINKSLNIEVIGKPIKISVHRKLVSSPLPAHRRGTVGWLRCSCAGVGGNQAPANPVARTSHRFVVAQR
jgi:hypothetical protein